MISADGSVLESGLDMASGLDRLEQVFRELAEPFRHRPWRCITHQCGQEQRFGDVDTELAVSLELLLIEELIQCRLVWDSQQAAKSY
jgi:hypothetical protein